MHVIKIFSDLMILNVDIQTVNCVLQISEGPCIIRLSVYTQI